MPKTAPSRTDMWKQSLPPGGHRLDIWGFEPTISRQGNPYLMGMYRIREGSEANKLVAEAFSIWDTNRWLAKRDLEKLKSILRLSFIKYRERDFTSIDSVLKGLDSISQKQCFYFDVGKKRGFLTFSIIDLKKKPLEKTTK